MRFTPNSILSITVVSVLPLCAIGAQGQVIMPQPADSAATEMLHEVTVTGSRHSGEVVRPQTLRDGYLATLNAHSVADAVRYFAGVQLKDYGGVGGIKTGGNVEIMVNGKYARDHMRYLNPDTTLMLIDNTFDQNELYLSATARYSPFRFWDIAVAADWQYNTLDSDMALFVFPSRHQLLGSVATALNFGGLRLRASLLANSIHDRTRPSSSAGSRRHFLKFTPAVFVAWIPQKSILPEVRCYWKKAFRMPTFNDLYYTDIGNASLDPETCTQFDIGATWRVENIATLLAMLEFSADAYYNHIVDKIIAVPKGNGQYRWMMMNLGLVKIRGVDLGITTMLNLPAGITGRMRLTYTWQSALDYSDPTDCRDDAGTYKGQIAYIPRHAAAVAAGLQWHGVDINYSWIYTGQRWDNSSNIPENHIQPWYTSDISAAYSFGLGNTMLRISLEINNLADQQYEVIRNYPMPGRNYKVIAQWNF